MQQSVARLVARNIHATNAQQHESRAPAHARAWSKVIVQLLLFVALLHTPIGHATCNKRPFFMRSRYAHSVRQRLARGQRCLADSNSQFSLFNFARRWPLLRRVGNIARARSRGAVLYGQRRALQFRAAVPGFRRFALHTGETVRFWLRSRRRFFAPSGTVSRAVKSRAPGGAPNCVRPCGGFNRGASSGAFHHRWQVVTVGRTPNK